MCPDHENRSRHCHPSGVRRTHIGCRRSQCGNRFVYLVGNELPHGDGRWTEDNRIAVRFAYEYHDDSGHWFRAYGNENWQFDTDGLMERRIASINEHPIAEGDRKFRWSLGRRPDDHPGLGELEL